jgi:hypothetical protein
MLLRLGIFVGSFTLEAVAAVAMGAPVEASDACSINLNAPGLAHEQVKPQTRKRWPVGGIGGRRQAAHIWATFG